MTWQALFENPRNKPRVVVTVRGERVECDILEEALSLTNDVNTWPTGLKPSGRYWLRRRDTGEQLFPRVLPK